MKPHFLNKNHLLYYGALAVIASLSFLVYAPCYLTGFDSDNAIHVLMSKNFEFPRDYYYWAQNRLGSLLPFLSHLLHTIIPIHYLYVCSIVQYLFLLTGFIILSRPIKSNLLKIALCAVIFLPVNEYNALILIGHPYSSQLFAGSLFIGFLVLLKKLLLSAKTFGFKTLLHACLLVLGASLFFYAGIWVSEFNAILILIPLYYVLFNKPVRDLLKEKFKNKSFIFIEILVIVCAITIYLLYANIKKNFVTVDGYTSFFITNLADLKSNFNFFIDKLTTSLLFRDNQVQENWFNWFIILTTGGLLYVRFFKRKSHVIPNRHLVNSLLVFCMGSVILLFFSTWNLRSAFCPRYFTPLYIIYCYLLLVWSDQLIHKKSIKVAIGIIFLLFCIGFCCKVIVTKGVRSPFEQYSDYCRLPKGTLMGNYWDVYKINAVAMDNLQSLPSEGNVARNWDFREIAFNETNFYFINDTQKIEDTVYQYNLLFKYSGTKYPCNGEMVLCYHMLSQKYLIKSLYSNKYWSLNDSSLLVSANQPDSSRADVFEVIRVNQDKVALRAPNGKFLCADVSRGSYLYANKSGVLGTWETFDLLPTADSAMTIRSSIGNFLCADQNDRGNIIANRGMAYDWEQFELIPKN